MPIPTLTCLPVSIVSLGFPFLHFLPVLSFTFVYDRVRLTSDLPVSGSVVAICRHRTLDTNDPLEF